MIRFEKANGYSEVIDPSKVKAVHRMVSCGSRPQSIIVLDQPNDNSVPVLGTVSEVKRKLRGGQVKYRVLKEGEVIREGDEVLADTGAWHETMCAGERVDRDLPGPYRRRVSNTDKIFKLAKRLGKHKVDWTFEPFADDLRALLQVLRKLEKETLGGAK